MKRITSYIILFVCLLLAVPMQAQTSESEQMKRYADEYAECENVSSRLRLANDFFSYLLKIQYIDEPIAFPEGSHIDSVDVNVYYYIAEYCYGEADYQSAVDYCIRATHHMGVVDDVSKSDVYALLGAAYFRQSAFD